MFDLKSCEEIKVSIYPWQITDEAMLVALCNQETRMARNEHAYNVEKLEKGERLSIYWQQSGDEHYRNARLLRQEIINNSSEHIWFRTKCEAAGIEWSYLNGDGPIFDENWQWQPPV